jgi:mycoredoxin
MKFLFSSIIIILLVSTQVAIGDFYSYTDGKPKVEVFMTSWCGYCGKMIRFLDEKGIHYTAYDIEKDKSAEAIYRRLGGRGVPVVRVGSHVVHGYDPEGVLAYYNGGN